MLYEFMLVALPGAVALIVYVTMRRRQRVQRRSACAR